MIAEIMNVMNDNLKDTAIGQKTKDKWVFRTSATISSPLGVAAWQ